ncbi:unnamed protein product [Ilex paraguariensis]|uniref:Transmembrane protein n=1 Tax=Ilex paraguariensis TaxID=185542 RepID=A0ABC8TKC9_9AQUA
MTDVHKLEDMDSENFRSSSELDEKGIQKVSISDQTNNSQYRGIKSDSFAVDMERFSHPNHKDVATNSRITLQRSLSRKGSQRGGEKKINPSTGNEKDTSVVASSSPRAAVVGASTLEKPMAMTKGATQHSINPGVHHQITIMTGNISTTSTVESKCGGKRFSFRRSSPSWAIDPRRILFFFATLSSVGTILLIYFTLSMGKIGGDDNALD